MKTLEAINYRTSYRGAYTNESVPEEDLKLILEAGLAAPSGCNTQTTSIVAVDDSLLLEKIRNIMTRPVGKTAPALIFVLAEFIPSYHGRCFAVQDYSAAIQNMLLEIVELGYESCWVEGYVNGDDGIGAEIAKILELDSKYKVVCMLPVGKAAESIKRVTKKSFDERAWFNIKK